MKNLFTKKQQDFLEWLFDNESIVEVLQVGNWFIQYDEFNKNKNEQE